MSRTTISRIRSGLTIFKKDLSTAISNFDLVRGFALGVISYLDNSDQSKEVLKRGQNSEFGD